MFLTTVNEIGKFKKNKKKLDAVIIQSKQIILILKNLDF